MNFWSNFEPGTQSPKRVKRTGLKFDILWVIEELFPLVKCISDQRIFACQLIVTMRSMSWRVNPLKGRSFLVCDVKNSGNWSTNV